MIKKEELKEKLNNVKGKVVEVGKKIALPAAMIAGVCIGVAVENWNDQGRKKGSFEVARVTEGERERVQFGIGYTTKLGKGRRKIITFYDDNPSYKDFSEMADIAKRWD